MNFFAVEIKRLIKSRTFWISVCIGCIITVSQFLLFSLPVKKYLDDFQPMSIGTLNPQIWLEKWIGGELVSPQAFFFFLIFPIIAVLPFAASLAFDRSSGYVAQFYIRGQRRNYYTAKYITTFLSGGVAVLIPLVLNIFLTMTVFPAGFALLYRFRPVCQDSGNP